MSKVGIANQSIKQLDDAGTLADGDLLIIQQGLEGVETEQGVTLSQVTAFVSQNISGIAGELEVSQIAFGVANDVLSGTNDLQWTGTALNIVGDILLTGTVDGIDVGTDVAANTTHSGLVTGNPHSVLATEISDFDTEVSNNSAVAANTSHSGGDGSDHADVATNTLRSQAIGLISGVSTGGEITINGGDNSKFDLAAGTGIIIDWSVPATPTFTEVSWIQQLAITVTDLATTSFSSLYMDSNGDIQQAGGSLITPQQRRQNIVLDSLVHPDNATISLISPLGVQSFQPANAIVDYIVTLGPINTGNGMSANGTDLAVQKAAGTTTLPWINRGVDPQNPSKKTNASQAPLSAWLYQHQDGVGGFTTLTGISAVDPEQFDDGSGTLAAVANNKYTIQRFFFFGQGVTSVSVYGQAEYNSIDEAQAAIFTESPVINPVSSIASFVTALVVKKGTVDLSNPANARFIDITTQVTTAAAGAGSQDLQATYNLSVDPEIITDSTRGALTLRRGSLLDADNVIEIQNAATTEVFAVTAEGNLTLSGTVDGIDIATDVAANTVHTGGNGSDHADVATNTTHSGGDGSDHADVATNTTHSGGSGSDHADVATNTTHSSGDGSDHADVATNTTHSSGSGSDHADVATNTTHSGGDGSDHADVASNTTDVAKALKSGISFIIDGGGSAITTGVKGDIEMPFAGTIDAARLFADQTGDIVVDIFNDTFANFPPLVGDSITASAKPTISSGIKDEDETLTGWTTAFAAGDVLRINVDSVTTLERVTLSLSVTKT